MVETEEDLMSNHAYHGLIACVALGLFGTDADAQEPRPAVQPASLFINTPPHPAESIDIRSLDLNSDYSIFVEKNCPAVVQKRALRHLWKLLPKPEPGSEHG
jgi:hypothetical protein